MIQSAPSFSPAHPGRAKTRPFPVASTASFNNNQIDLVCAVREHEERTGQPGCMIDVWAPEGRTRRVSEALLFLFL